MKRPRLAAINRTDEPVEPLNLRNLRNLLNLLNPLNPLNPPLSVQKKGPAPVEGRDPGLVRHELRGTPVGRSCLNAAGDPQASGCRHQKFSVRFTRTKRGV